MRVVVTGGGTGGHLFPAVAVAGEIQRRFAGSEILFVGTGRRIDERVLADLGFARTIINCSGVKGMGPLAALVSALRLPLAMLQAGRILKRFKPDLVFAVGGYVTGPVVAAARIFGVPICIHEQNSVPGLANRVAGKVADRVCISLPCQPSFAEKKTVLTGNPVREELLLAARGNREEIDATFTLLVLGGSQGAHRVNELVLEAAGLVQDQGMQLRIIHQTGQADEEWIGTGYKELGMQAEVSDFYKDMAEVYRRADLVISRAGATTLAELAVMGLPALLIPYPFAADDHQTKNGAYYVQGGGARLFAETELNGEKLAEEIEALIQRPRELQGMAAAMKSLAKPDATERIVDVCIELAG